MSDVDDAIHARISKLIDQEHELRQQLADKKISPESERAKLTTIETQLDQAWDLLRQRAAKREFGEDPNDAKPRSGDVVEGYLG